MSEKHQAEKLRLNSNWDHREKAGGIHSAPRWRLVTWLAGVVLISCTLMGSQVVAQEWKEGDLRKNRSIDSAPDFAKNCEESKANRDSDSCSLWGSVKKCCVDKHPNCHVKGVPQKCYKNYGYTLFDEGKCHFMLVPTDPVIGVEDKNNRGKHNYWGLAWNAAVKGYWKIKRLSKWWIGLAINPAGRRSQHQLHIHIGSVTKFRDKLQEKYVPHNSQWHKIKNGIKGHKCYAKFFEGNFPRVFHEVSKEVKEHNMKHTGIIVAGSHKKDKKKGFYIVNFYDKNHPKNEVYVEGLLDYNFH